MIAPLLAAGLLEGRPSDYWFALATRLWEGADSCGRGARRCHLGVVGSQAKPV